MGEWFMDNGMDALIVFDDLSKHAAAYREVSLILKRPSGREAYPGDVFYLHSRLLERAARVGSAAQIKAMKQVAGKLKGELAQFRELAAFAQFGSDLDAKTQAQINRGKRIMEVFKQAQYNPVPVEVQVVVLWVVQNGYVDEVPVERVKEYQTKLAEFLTTRKMELLRKISKEKTLSDALIAELKSAAEEFKPSFPIEKAPPTQKLQK